MTDRISGIFGAEAKPRTACRIAYTINNHQPVQCTIISDQPLFYMDYQIDAEDEPMLDAADMGILESELETLKREIDSFDHFSQGFAQPADQCLQDFLADSQLLSEEPGTEDIAGSLKTLTESLAKSRLGGFYMDFAREHGVQIRLSPQIEDGYYDRAAGLILIHPQLDLADRILVAARELRRHWQHRNGALIHPLMFHPDNAILVNRAQVADLSVAMVRIAWELQLSGIKNVWERVENSSMGDLGRAFAREAFLDFRTINNGTASAAVFEGWFLSERCRIEDKKLIKQMLADYKGYVFDLEQSETAITPALLSALGSMPFGKNYLAAHANVIMNDQIFTEVRDRSNANFLWFIKFERSFRETEQELQSKPDHQAAGVRRADSHKKKSQDYTYVNAQAISFERAPAQPVAESARIIPLFGAETGKAGDKSAKPGSLLRSKPVGKRRKSKKTGPSAQIVYLRARPGE